MGAPAAEGDKASESGMDERHAPELLRVLAAELECEPSAIMDFEMPLCDTQPSQVWGLNSELISAPRCVARPPPT